ncbi:NAD(P)-binding protein [Penicillium chermesinum]|uniref:NAD(P)-binding protein n=1 Tax=Penicillium chermesinum TaxID=63820 RepID=A0A9W9NUE5_9EURO|nr:NAD(P)-binding protein [Penicillium chermesinum]KAJ5226411.1 NAD(P)-binding protein [Penicillium chermesinum]KAJ6160405.1 NAD(P)-binding protein [Penicillium chermesinum]
MSYKRSVLITGCSDGGLGAALALEFHKAGFHVYATSRNPDKMKGLAAKGIDILALDVLSEESISIVVKKLPSLDILVNNAGQGYTMPIADLDVTDAKRIFDLNVWSYISVAQAFLPLIRKSSHGMIVNQTSVTSAVTVPFQGVYNASKAAIAMFSDTLRLEMESLGIQVVDLRTGNVLSNIGSNSQAQQRGLPHGSLYEPAREVMNKVLRGEGFAAVGWPAERWASEVVRELQKNHPPKVIWKGANAWLVRIGTILPAGTLDGTARKMSKLDLVSEILKAEASLATGVSEL